MEGEFNRSDSDLSRRFWAKVRKGEGCWEWTGARKSNGYGALGVGGKVLLTHRVAWNLERGLIPAGALILHHCDNRPCVKPEHLYVCTHRDNSQDMVRRGRCGPRKVKLSDDQVRLIRALYRAMPIDMAHIARLYGITPTSVSYVVSRKRRNRVADIAS